MTLAEAIDSGTYQEDTIKTTLYAEDAESGRPDQQDVVLTFKGFAEALNKSGLGELQAAEGEMAAVAAERLRELNRLGGAGQRSAIVMLGPKGGVLVADWAANKVFHLALVVPGEAAPVGATPAVCAETQLQRGLMSSIHWALQRRLKDPLIAGVKHCLYEFVGGSLWPLWHRVAVLEV